MVETSRRLRLDERRLHAMRSTWWRSSKGVLRYYNLTNEWDAQAGGTTSLDADEYVSLSRDVFPWLKAIDSGIVVMSGGISDKGIRERLIERLLDLRGLQLVDAISIHPYVWSHRSRPNPEAALDNFDYVESVARAANGGKEVPLYITEIVWPTHAGRFGLNDDEASWFLRPYFIHAASRTYVRWSFWYWQQDQGDDPTKMEHRFGFFGRPERLWPAAREFRRIVDLLSPGDRMTSKAQNRRWVAEFSSSGAVIGRFCWLEADDEGSKAMGASMRYGSAQAMDSLRRLYWTAVSGASGAR